MAKIKNVEAQAQVPANKKDIILSLLEAGGATNESLMAGADVKMASVASNLAYIRNEAKAIVKKVPAMANEPMFPLKNKDGVYEMVDMATWDAAQAEKAVGKPKKVLTPEEELEAAQKREDKASAKFTKAKDAYDADNNRVNELRMIIADAELELASIAIGHLQAGFSSLAGE